MNSLRHAQLLAALFLGAAPAAAQIQLASVPCVADAAIYSESGAVANGSGENLFVGANSAGNVRRSLVRFDLASAVPPGSVVVGAYLSVSVNQGNPGPEPLRARRVLASWAEGPANPSGSEGQGAAASGSDVTWTLRDFAAGLAWAAPGGDLALENSFSGNLSDSGTSGFDATAAGLADIQAWVDQPALNLGWALLGNETTASSAKRLDSRTAANANARPLLQVTYFAPGAQPSTFCPANANSTGGPASIASSGTTSVAANAFTLLASGLPVSSAGTFFFGPRDASAVAFGDGILCVAGPFRRLGVQSVSPAGTVSRGIDFSTFPGTLLAPGSRAAFQFWFRDPAAGGAGFSVSNALLVPFFP
ncbi:MAG: DNRLRE domain-containing protein [Planctomycetota bacterium]|nr:DNRLRE domain-containing protein [Planctomycetota bacterium]